MGWTSQGVAVMNKGFTLIELVVVIVILGILAVTAAPRFLNLQSDARESVLSGTKGAISGADGIVYGKAAIEGVESFTSGSEAVIDINGKKVSLMFGHPLMRSDVIPSIMETDVRYVDAKDGDGVHLGLLFYVAKEKKTAEDVAATECYLEAKNDLNNGEIIYDLAVDGC